MDFLLKTRLQYLRVKYQVFFRDFIFDYFRTMYLNYGLCLTSWCLDSLVQRSSLLPNMPSLSYKVEMLRVLPKSKRQVRKRYSGFFTMQYALIPAQFCSSLWVLFSTEWYGEKTTKHVISLDSYCNRILNFIWVCVLMFLLYSCNLAVYNELNKKLWDILLWLPFLIPDLEERKPTWQSQDIV